MKKQIKALILVVILAVALFIASYVVIKNIHSRKEDNIVNSEEGIIEIFNNNYDLFESIANYFENSKDSFYY